MTYRCALCGYAFEPGEEAERACRSCPVSGGDCGLVKCPACGYEWPDERRSAAAGLLARIFGRGKGGG